MSIQSPFVTVEIIALILCMITIGIAWRYRKKNPIIVPLIALLSMTSVWLFSSIGGLSSTDQTINLNWAKVEYIAVVSVPLLLLNFSLHYSLRQRWLTKKRLCFLLIIPVVTLVLAWTNDLHSLIWSQYAVYQESGLTLSEKTYGSWFWVYWIYSYLILFIASIIIIRSVIISSRIYRIHGLLIILAILSPWIGNLIYVLNVSPIENLDLTPLAFTLTGLLLTAGMLRWRLFDIVPIARTKVIEEMADAVIVLDQLGRIVDANPSAEHILGIDIHNAHGRQASDVLPVKLTLLIQRTSGDKQYFELTLSFQPFE